MRIQRMLCHAAGLAALAFPAIAGAQTCLGQAEYDGGKYRVGAMSRTNSEANLYAATLGTGEPGSQFIDGHYGRASLSTYPLTVTSWGLRTGMPIEFRGTSGLQFCPFVSVENIDGTYKNSAGTKLGIRSNSYALSAALGSRAFRSEEVQLLPFIAGELRFVSAAGAVEYEGVGGPTLISSTMYEGVTVGMGIVIKNALTVRPTYFQSIGLKKSRNSIGFAVNWTIGN